MNADLSGVDVARHCCLALIVAFSVTGRSPVAANGPGGRDVAGKAPPSTVVSAAEGQRWDRLAELINHGADVGVTQPDGMTALHWAAFHRHVPSVERLLEAGADPRAATHYQITPLTVACTAGGRGVVAALLRAGADPNLSLPGGETPLMIASRAGRPEPVTLLLEAGARVDATERAGQTALMWAAAEGHAEVVDRLVQAGADPARTLDSGLTAMMFAAREGRPAVVERLLKAGVDINAVTDPERNPRGRDPRRGTSALMLAVENGHFELALKLIDAGADPNDQRSGYSPLHAMSWTRKANRGEGIDGDPIPRVSGSVSSLEFVRELIARGADVNLRLGRGRARGKAKLNPRGATPFLLASKTADLPLLRLLVELGADPLIPNADGCTPIMAAAGIGVTAVGEEAGTEPEVLRTVRFLAERGADLDTVDDNGETVMHGAAYRSYPAVADLLTELGADPHVWYRENRHGWTPHRIAQGYRPGSFKPSPEMIAAIERALRGAGIEPPGPDNGPDAAEEERWEKPDKR